MKFMKRIITISMIICLMFSFAACGGKNPDALYTKDGKEISLGMSQSKIEGIIGKGKSVGASKVFYFDNYSLMVSFDEKNNANSLFVNRDSKYYDYKGNKVGDSYSKCKSSYDSKYVNEGLYKGAFTISFSKDRKFIEKENKSDKKDFYILYSKGQTGDKITSFLIDRQN